MKYCEIKDNGISITLPRTMKRFEHAILKSALAYGAFADAKGTSIDETGEKQHHIAVIFPEETNGNTMQDFAEKVNAAIEALIERVNIAVEKLIDVAAEELA